MKEKMNGFITAVHRERYEVRANGEDLYARLKAGIYYTDHCEEEFPTVGDNVELEYNPLGDCLIIKTMERKTAFSRKDPDVGMGEQIVAANFDYVFILMSLNYDFNLKRLERYLTVSWQSGGQPVIVLTKADIAEDTQEKLELVNQIALGVDVCVVSAVTGEGMEQLKNYLVPEKTTVFLGSSGVGKSTFTNYLLGKELMETGEIREDDSKGHHTTTHRQLFVMDNGARIIDTPGMRELGMWVVDDGIDFSFTDINDLIIQCRFSNCTHNGEPGCAVAQALKEGTLTEKRWKNYWKIQKESEFQAAKESRKQAVIKKKSNKKSRGEW
ncbi:ribosome biogenesis GTPase [Lacrimispora xylanisolvens]|uniref:Small ribosomal subunit biogenesis GTPase RsgA n=1 Tax=Lacrimispora xylanisolvens TaxID=384636 RepID=A0A2S6HH51_9FIRM|nr:ribosome small subunit-dependent GTPase A [Hungatella xylanolytica]PPK76797.1 ribosome biogenesis GTPase [Hungatella xylanolytica]